MLQSVEQVDVCRQRLLTLCPLSAFVILTYTKNSLVFPVAFSPDVNICTKSMHRVAYGSSFSLSLISEVWLANAV